MKRKTFAKLTAILLAAVMLAIGLMMPTAAKDSKTGDIISFGSYPQSLVKDEAVADALNAAVKAEDWVSYRYITTDETESIQTRGDWMQYADVTLNGTKYRGVRFTEYRAYWTYGIASEARSYIARNGYSVNTTYWFRWDPLRWRVLDPATGLVMSESILDAQAFNDTVYRPDRDKLLWYADESNSIYATEYEYSSIRKWLTEDFLNAAFTEAEQAKIAETALDNSAEQTEPAGIGGKATTDRVFLLSENDVRTASYGFSEAANEEDPARMMTGSDYAKCQGLWVEYSKNNDGRSYWWLRTASGNSGHTQLVTAKGSLFMDSVFALCGIRPAFCFSAAIIDEPDKQTDPVTEPISGEPSVTEPPVPALPRGDADGDGKVLAKDARLALRVSAKLETLDAAAFDRCDLDGDGRILAGEARKILRYSAKLEKEI